MDSHIEKKIRILKLRRKLKIILIINIAVLLTLFIFVISNSGDVIDLYAKNELNRIVQLHINEEAMKHLVSGNYTYDKFCKIDRDDNNRITSIIFNNMEMNIFTAEINIVIADVFDKNRDKMQFNIPIGNFLSARLLSGRGFDIKIKAVPVGMIECDIISRFDQAGINQTLHRIYLQYSVKLNISGPISRAESLLNGSFCIAETVIIGEVPHIYLNNK